MTKLWIARFGLLLLLALIGFFAINISQFHLRPKSVYTYYNQDDITRYQNFTNIFIGHIGYTGARLIIPVFPSMVETQNDPVPYIDVSKPIIGEISAWCATGATTIDCKPSANDLGMVAPIRLDDASLRLLFEWGARQP